MVELRVLMPTKRQNAAGLALISDNVSVLCTWEAAPLLSEEKTMFKTGLWPVLGRGVWA